MWSRTIQAGTIDVLLGHIVKKSSKHGLQQGDDKICVLKRIYHPEQATSNLFYVFKFYHTKKCCTQTSI